MKKIKKILGVLLAAATVCNFAACGKKSGGDAVTLEWWYRGNGMQADTQLVEDTLNEKLKNYEGMDNVKIHLNCSPASDYQTNVTLAMSGGKQIDILNTVNLNFDDMCNDGYLLDIDEYINKNEKLKNTLPDWLWKLGGYNGKTYMVPNYQMAALRTYVVFPKAYTDVFPQFETMKKILKNKNSTVEETAKIFEDYLLAVRKAYPNEQKYLYPIGKDYNEQVGFAPQSDKLTGTHRYYADENKVANQYATPWAKESYRYSAQWYEKGYIHPDISTIDINNFINQNMMNPTSFIYSLNHGMYDDARYAEEMKKTYGFDVEAVSVTDDFYQQYTWEAGGNCVTKMCKNPDKAMRFIELMTTEEGKDIYNLMVYGIEGKHYEKTGENTIRTFEYDGSQGGGSTSYAAMKWIIGNTFNAYINQGGSEEFNALALEINKSDRLRKSPLIGLRPNTNDVRTKIEQIQAIATEYKDTLSYGIMGSKWENTYTEFEDKLKLAGDEDIINCYTKQIEEFLKK